MKRYAELIRHQEVSFALHRLTCSGLVCGRSNILSTPFYRPIAMKFYEQSFISGVQYPLPNASFTVNRSLGIFFNDGRARQVRRGDARGDGWFCDGLLQYIPCQRNLRPGEGSAGFATQAVCSGLRSPCARWLSPSKRQQLLVPGCLFRRHESDRHKRSRELFKFPREPRPFVVLQ